MPSPSFTPRTLPGSCPSTDSPTSPTAVNIPCTSSSSSATQTPGNQSPTGNAVPMMPSGTSQPLQRDKDKELVATRSGTTLVANTRDGQSTPSEQGGVQSDEEPDRIQGWADVQEAISLAWEDRRSALFTTWVHVPIGCLFILVVCWALDLLVSTVPGLSFPGPVVGCLLTFAILLLLDWLSLKFPGAPPPQDPEAANAAQVAAQKSHDRRFVRPVMAFIGEPSDFLLRNMSLLFTPAFVSIPAREALPGREVGIIAAYFILTQIAGYVLPTLVCKGMDFTMKSWDARRGHSGSDLEKTAMGEKDVHEGRSFGVVAHGVKNVTRLSIAPISISMTPQTNRELLAEQARREHVDHVQREQARQQGAMTFDSDYSNLQHLRHLHQLHQHRPRTPSRPRHLSQGGRSVSLMPRARLPHGSSQRPVTSTGHEEKSQLSKTPQRPITAAGHESQATSPISPSSTVGDTSIEEHPISLFDPGFSLKRTPTWHGGSPEVAPTFLPHEGLAPHEEEEIMSVSPISPASPKSPASPHPSASPTSPTLPLPEVNNVPRTSFATQDVMDVVRSVVEPTEGLKEVTPASLPRLVMSRRPSAMTIVAEEPSEGASRISQDKVDQDNGIDEKAAAARGRRRSRRGSAVSNISLGEPDAIDRLADRLTTYLTPALYLLAFFIGLPLFYVLNFSLLLFLSVNVLTFWIAITVIPPKVRRFLHPILTTAAMTLLTIWALGAIKGLSLKQTILEHYTLDAKYDSLFSPSGYNGPVPGAADVLSSLLDAGILALSVVLYRYRRDLAECGVRLIIGLLPSVAFSLFLCPALASLVSLDEIRSLAFAGRFLSTPLAIELVETLQGDVDICIVLVVVTGIVAALLKEPFFRFMRVDMDDHLTVGLAMGATSGAIGASSLIARPRVMAVASLSFILFGTFALVLVAIPPITTQIRVLARL